MYKYLNKRTIIAKTNKKSLRISALFSYQFCFIEMTIGLCDCGTNLKVTKMRIGSERTEETHLIIS